MHIDEMLRRMVEKKSSDLILRALYAPVLRIHGGLYVQGDFPVLTQEDLLAIMATIANDEQRARFEKDLELDLAYSIPKVGRFRVNVMKQRGTLGFTFRLVPFDVPTIDELKLPQICKELISEAPRAYPGNRSDRQR